MKSYNPLPGMILHATVAYLAGFSCTELRAPTEEIEDLLSYRAALKLEYFFLGVKTIKHLLHPKIIDRNNLGYTSLYIIDPQHAVIPRVLQQYTPGLLVYEVPSGHACTCFEKYPETIRGLLDSIVIPIVFCRRCAHFITS